MTSLYAYDCVRLHMHVIRCVCVWNFGMNSSKGGGGGEECKTRKKFNFFEKGKNGNCRNSTS